MRDRGETIRNGAIQLLLAVNAVIMIYPLFVM
ncbi:carbohydrate ABC transporter permease, partial [Mesorhizobium sp. M2A.F.Ca.ET.040.01.1.1]